MAKLRPFKGIFYDTQKVGELNLVIAPPYDVISSEAQEHYYTRHPNNVIRLILGKKSSSDSDKHNRYTRAQKYFEEWQRQSLFIRDEQPSFYLYQQKFKVAKKGKSVRGIISLVKLEKLGSGILPHEKTMPKPKKDRLYLMRACRANMDQIFSLYSDPKNEIDTVVKTYLDSPALLEVQDEDGVLHQIYRIAEEDTQYRISKIIDDKILYIADGHHRYETALTYQEDQKRKFSELDEQPYDYIMMLLVNLDSEDLTVLPNHRLLKTIPFSFTELKKRLETFFEIKQIEEKKARKELVPILAEQGKEKHVFALYVAGEGFHLLALRDGLAVDGAINKNHSSEWKHLDVSILHSLILEQLLGFKEKQLESNDFARVVQKAELAIEKVDNGEYKVAFFLNPTKIEEIRKIASNRERMPQKSTYFYPKLLSGLIINKHEW